MENLAPKVHSDWWTNPQLKYWAATRMSRMEYLLNAIVRNHNYGGLTSSTSYTPGLLSFTTPH